MALSKLKKGLLITGIVLVTLIVLVIAFISPITKYLIEKYDEKYTGRQITLDWAYVNPFTGSLYLRNLKVYDQQKDSVFFSFKGLSVGISLPKLLAKKYEITEVTLDRPFVFISQNKKKFNFDDIVAKFAKPKDTVKVADTTPVYLNIKNITIKDGELQYFQQEVPVRYGIKKLNFESTGKFFDRDTLIGKFSLEPAKGSGRIKGDFTINTTSNAFRIATVIEKFNLDIVEQYLKDFSNYGKFTATLDADVNATGNFKDQENINLHGYLALNDFRFGKITGEDYASFKKLAVNLIDVSPKNKVYEIDSIMLSHAFFRFEKYDSLDNVQRMFGKKGSKVDQAKAQQPQKFNLILEIADYVNVLAHNFFHSYYKLNKLAVYDADIQYHDYSLRERFTIGMNPLSIVSDSIDKNKKRFNMSVNTGIKPYGNVAINLSMNPSTEGDFDMNYQFQKIPASMFNPYLVTYTSYPFDRGTIEINGDWQVRNEKIQSNNHFLFIDPRVTKKVKKKDTKWIPMPLIMAFIRERGNVIDYQVPITGNLKDPKFNVKDVIFDVLKNIVVKPATTPYRFEVKEVEQAVEKSLTIKWTLKQSTLLASQENFLENIAEFLKNTPDASIDVQPLPFTAKEKEYILFFEAKKKYFHATRNMSNKPLDQPDSVLVDKMSVKDRDFVKWLNRQAKDSLLNTVQEKCRRVVSEKLVNAKLKSLEHQRKEAFLQFFRDNGTDSRVRFLKEDPSIPFNGNSTYKILYKGEVPDDVRAAYDQLEELNNENPRKKYKKERKKIFGLF